MGFTVTASLFGLPSFSWYVSIKGTYTIEKNIFMAGIYRIRYQTYYSASASTDAKISEVQFMSLQQLPEPADVYSIIYANIKLVLGDLSYTDD